MIYYISEQIGNTNNAIKARKDIESILETRYSPKYVYIRAKGGRLSKCIDIYSLIRKTSRKDYIVIQYPMPMGYNWLLKPLSYVRNIILIIHDLTELRGGDDSGKEINKIATCEYIISHNEFMTRFLVRNGVAKEKIIDLEIFDYLADSEFEKNHYLDDNMISYVAGDLSKAKFLGILPSGVCDLGIKLYGINFKFKEKSGLQYCGSVDSSVLHDVIDGRFGLVWDGNSIDSCSGNFGKYLQYNNPHKVSMYITAGMPVIVWKKAAIAKFIEKKGIGFSVSSIEEIPERVLSISEMDYKEMQKNVFNLRKRITKGDYINEALNIIENKIFNRFIQ